MRPKTWLLAACLATGGIATAAENLYDDIRVSVPPRPAAQSASTEEAPFSDAFRSPEPPPAPPPSGTAPAAGTAPAPSTAPATGITAPRHVPPESAREASLPADTSAPGTLVPGDLAYLRARLEKDIESTPMTAREQAILTRLLAVVRQLEAAPPAEAFAAEAVAPIDAGQPERQYTILDDLRRAVTQSPRNREARLRLAAFYIFNNDPVKAIRQLDLAGDLSNGDVFWKLHSAYCQLALGEYAAALPLLDDASRLVETVMPLGLQNGIFCEQVTALAQYVPLKNQALVRGQRALVYFEVAGSEFVKGEDDLYQTAFTIGLTFRDEMQRVILSLPAWASPRFNYRRPLREIFMTGEIMLPPECEPGKKYFLVIECRDTHALRSASLSIPFTVTVSAGK